MSEAPASTSYCVNLFTQVATDNFGHYRPCCLFHRPLRDPDGRRFHVGTHDPEEFFNSNVMQDLRSQANSGAKVEGCERCYAMEEKGLSSMRTRHNSSREKISDEAGGGVVQKKIRAADIRVGNTCNLGCMTCAPESSSVIAAEVVENNLKGFENSASRNFDLMNWAEDDNVIGRLTASLSEISYLWILGGEPFYSKTTSRLLDSCESQGRGKGLEVEISTNVTRMNGALLRQLKAFDSRIDCSIDGIGEFAAYIRYPSKYEKVEQNLKQLLEAGIHVNIVCTVSVFNIFHIRKLCFRMMELLNQAKGKATFSVNNIVTVPEHLSPGHLPETVRRRAIRDLQNLIEEIEPHKCNGIELESFHRLVRYLEKSHGDGQLIAQRWHLVEQFDSLRGTSWKQIVPWMEEVLNQANDLK